MKLLEPKNVAPKAKSCSKVAKHNPDMHSFIPTTFGVSNDIYIVNGKIYKHTTRIIKQVD